MLVLMYRKGHGKGGKAEGGLIYLTSVNICVRTYVSPSLGAHCVCVISVSVAAHTVRMRNFCCFLCFCFSSCLSFRHAVLWFLYIHPHLSLPLSSFWFSVFSLGFPSLFHCFLDCSFDYISINWWQFYVCTSQHLSAFQMFIFYDALGRFIFCPSHENL